MCILYEGVMDHSVTRFASQLLGNPISSTFRKLSLPNSLRISGEVWGLGRKL